MLKYISALKTDYKPESISDIITADSRKRIANAVRDQVRDMRAFRRGLPTRTAKPLVIGQDGFVPEARGIVWDTPKLHFDDATKPNGYFKPLDFDAAPPSHLNNQKFFDMLGPDYNDQELRHMLVTGFFMKIAPPLQIVILPHLLSLADAFDNVDKELDRLASPENNYLKFIAANHGHIDRASDDDICLAFGTLPFRANPQGSRKKKHTEKYRRINDAGAPHQLIYDESGCLCEPLNEYIAKSPTPNGPEVKHMPKHALQSNAVLQHAAYVRG